MGGDETASPEGEEADHRYFRYSRYFGHFTCGEDQETAHGRLHAQARPHAVPALARRPIDLVGDPSFGADAIISVLPSVTEGVVTYVAYATHAARATCDK